MRHQSAITLCMHSLLQAINSRLVSFVMSEYTGSQQDRNLDRQLNTLRIQIQNWFYIRHVQLP